jgi:hypothetical protein
MGNLLFAWLFFALVVGIAASARDRSFLGWTIIAAILSPLLGLIFLLCLPNRRHEKILRETAAVAIKRNDQPKNRWGRQVTRETVDRDGDFRPDGVYAGIPYRVTGHGNIEAVMHGKVVTFTDMDKFIAMVGDP